MLTPRMMKVKLHCIAIKNGFFELASMLIEQGLDVNAKNDEGETALHSAIKNGFFELASMLIDSDIDIEAKTFYLGSTALHIAVKKTT
jgi:ankyrin repeat protein